MTYLEAVLTFPAPQSSSPPIGANIIPIKKNAGKTVCCIYVCQALSLVVKFETETHDAHLGRKNGLPRLQTLLLEGRAAKARASGAQLTFLRHCQAKQSSALGRPTEEALRATLIFMRALFFRSARSFALEQAHDGKTAMAAPQL